jgi:RES domain-containing protein
VSGTGLNADDAGVPLLTVSGPFFRAVLAERLQSALAPPDAASAGRYHRLGQPALYMSPSSEWATIAVSGYIREDRRPRVILPLMISSARVFDQRDEAACRRLGIDRDLSNQPWRPVLAAGGEPASWRNADAARAAGADGIVDRSRLIPGGWHVNLFRWNDLGGPSVEICGDPVPIRLSDGTEEWGL